MAEICNKFFLDPSLHTMIYKGNPIPPEINVSKIADGPVSIVERSSDQQTAQDDEAAGETFWYRHLAQKYKRYNVIYILKRGIKNKPQNAILGIDGEHITHNYTTGSKKRGPNKQHMYQIRDVVKCQLNDDGDEKGDNKGRQFTVQFRNNKVSTFEATTCDVASS